MDNLVDYSIGILIAFLLFAIFYWRKENNMRKFLMVVLMAVGCSFAAKIDSAKVHVDSVKHPLTARIPDSLKHRVDSAIAVKKAEKPTKIAVDSLQKVFKAKRDSLVGTIKDVRVKAAVRTRIDSVEARHYRLRDKIDEKKEIIKNKTAK